MTNQNNFQNNNQNKIIVDLEQKVERIRKNLIEIKKPLIVEFTGTPKSGKTTSINALSTFFRRNNIPNEIIVEQGPLCPIRDKHNYFFDTWTGIQTLAHIIRVFEENEPKIILVDKGIFDTLVWINYQKITGGISLESFERVENFLLNKDWIERIDIIAVLTVSPDKAIERDYQSQITNIQGDIMNLDTLTKFNVNLRKCVQYYKKNIHCPFQELDTSSMSPLEGVKRIADKVISTADSLKDSQIAHVSMKLVQDFLIEKRIETNRNIIMKMIELMGSDYRWNKRSEIEKNYDSVQLVPIAVIKFNNELLLFDIRGREHGPYLDNKRSIWAGGHTRKEDTAHFPAKYSLIDLFQQTIVRELSEEISFNINIKNLNKFPRAIVWLDENPKSMQHLGIFYEYKISSKIQFEALNKREFRELRNKSLRTEFVPIESISDTKYQIESWSSLYLRTVYGLDLTDRDYQRRIVG